jgi:putative glutathione S-transferase
VRPDSKFQNFVSSEPGSKFPVEAGRYHLYIANNCPWCHRAVLGRAMLGLQDVISMDVLRFRRDPDRGWVFDPSEDGCGPDTAAGGITAIRDLYEREGSSEKSVRVPTPVCKQHARVDTRE